MLSFFSKATPRFIWSIFLLTSRHLIHRNAYGASLATKSLKMSGLITWTVSIPCSTREYAVGPKRRSNNYVLLLNAFVLVSRPNQDDDRLRVQGVPIIGGFSQRLNITVPLSCILLLKQSERTAVRRLDRSAAHLRLMRQIVTPAYIGQRDRRAILSLMAEFSDEVTRTTPVFELEFTLDKELLWGVVEELERALKKEVAQNG